MSVRGELRHKCSDRPRSHGIVDNCSKCGGVFMRGGLMLGRFEEGRTRLVATFPYSFSQLSLPCVTMNSHSWPLPLYICTPMLHRPCACSHAISPSPLTMCRRCSTPPGDVPPLIAAHVPGPRALNRLRLSNHYPQGPSKDQPSPQP